MNSNEDNLMKQIVNNMSKVIVGKDHASKLMVIALASAGHVL